MLILGLGSNLGDRLAYLRHALQLIKKIPAISVVQISPVYISDALLPENAPDTWDKPYLNLALRCETTLNPYDLLQHLKDIEKIIDRKPEKKWGPRVIDIDILAWDDLIQYDEKLHIPHEHLHERPFALWPLADVAPHWIYPLPGPHQGKTAVELAAQWGSRFSGAAPLHTKQIPQRIDTPQLIGILNVTPDSFSDGGKFLEIPFATQQMHYLVTTGAEIIDIGAESTNPKSTAIDSTSEWQRLEPILKNILAERDKLFIPPKISVDTRHADVAKKALMLGVDWINDVSGLSDPAMCEIIAAHTCDTVIMHSLSIPVGKKHFLAETEDAIAIVKRWADEKLNQMTKYGIALEKLILDVGIGFGKTAAQSLALIKNINLFRDFGVRLLVGHSRKLFLTQFTDSSPSERDIETLTLSLFLANQQIDFLRVHNVDVHARAFKVAARMQNEKEISHVKNS